MNRDIRYAGNHRGQETESIFRPGRPGPFQVSMTAFLKIDECDVCKRSLPWEWVPVVLLGGKPLAGTGVWCSQLSGRLCPACQGDVEHRRQDERLAQVRRRELVQLLGGEKPFREFTFERYQVASGNRLAFERCSNFDPESDNLYLWGPCGVGKTHLAYATARRCSEKTLKVAILPVCTLSRKTRMKEPAEEQRVIDELINADLLILDDLGAGPNTSYSQQLLQEILDARDFRDRAGLVVTSGYSLDGLAQKMGHDATPSRLAGMCREGGWRTRRKQRR